MADEHSENFDQASPFLGDDGEDRILSALNHLGTSAQRDGVTSWESLPSWQEAQLKEWATGLGLLLDFDVIAEDLVRGGQEHDVVVGSDCYLKVTRGGYFGLSPGTEQVVVSSGI